MDKILKKIILTQNKNKPINTENLDITGKNAKLRRELELELLKKQLEEEKRQRELAQQEAREARIRQQAYENANEQLRKFMEKAEQNKKENEEERKKQKESELRNINNFGSNLFEIGKNISLGGIGLGLLGAIITPVCPVAGPLLIGTGIGSGITGVAGAGIGETIAETSRAKLEAQQYEYEEQLRRDKAK